MKWDACFVFYIALFFGAVSECRTNIAPLTETKKRCDEFATDAQQDQTNEIGASTPETNTGNSEILCDENYPNDDDYVVDDNEPSQNDQPSDRHLRFPYSYGSIRKQPHHQFDKQKSAQQRDDHQNVEYTKEVVIKQGRLKGLVRRMHAQSGLRNVDQYLGLCGFIYIFY